MDKLNDSIVALRDKLNTTGVHLVLMIVMGVLAAKVPDAYQWIPETLMAVFASIGVTLSSKQKARVSALMEAHAEAVDVITQVADSAGIDTTDLRVASGHPAIQPKP